MQIAGWLLGLVRRDGVCHHARDARCSARRRRHVKTHFKNQSATEGGQLLSLPFFIVLIQSYLIFHFFFNECVSVNLSDSLFVSMCICFFAGYLSLFYVFCAVTFTCFSTSWFLQLLFKILLLKTPSNSDASCFSEESNGDHSMRYEPGVIYKAVVGKLCNLIRQTNTIFRRKVMSFF